MSNTICPDCKVAPRVFGEALFACIECPKCGDFVMGVGIPDLKERWYRGERGIVDRERTGETEEKGEDGNA